jgi:Na+-translocating ferredoxin:NAD+ oxidoreductase RnfC subunit
VTHADALRQIERLEFRLRMVEGQLQVARTLDSRCAYCGEMCRGYACPAHSDLVQLDPYRQAKRPRLTLVASSASASDTNGG